MRVWLTGAAMYAPPSHLIRITGIVIFDFSAGWAWLRWFRAGVSLVYMFLGLPMLQIGTIYLSLCSPHLAVPGWLLGQGGHCGNVFSSPFTKNVSSVETLQPHPHHHAGLVATSWKYTIEHFLTSTRNKQPGSMFSCQSKIIHLPEVLQYHLAVTLFSSFSQVSGVLLNTLRTPPTPQPCL